MLVRIEVKNMTPITSKKGSSDIGKQYQIPVNVGKGINEILLGSEWLKLLRLVVDFPEGILTLG